MSAQYIVVAEADLSGSAYGAKISTTDLLEKEDAIMLLDRIAMGQPTDVYTPYKHGITVRVSDHVLLDISRGRATSMKQTRISVAEVVSDRT